MTVRKSVTTKIQEDESSSSDESPKVFPQSYIIIKFAPKTKDKTLAWFIRKIKGKRQDGGAELLVRRQPYKEKEVFNTLLVIYIYYTIRM